MPRRLPLTGLVDFRPDLKTPGHAIWEGSSRVGLQITNNSIQKSDKVLVARVAVILLNWNGWRFTVAAARSLRPSAAISITTIVVDNASIDGSLRHLRAKLPGAEIIAHSINAGFAAGCNLGIRRALELNCDYIFLLNNDAFVCHTTISGLVEESRRQHDRVLLGSAVCFAASGEYQFFGSRYCNRKAQPVWFRCPEEEHLLAQQLIKTDFVLGAALFAHRDVFELVGLLDERYYLNYEDVDLCYRARRLGIESAIVPRSIVYHHGSMSVGPYSAPLQTYFLTRNELLFSEKHFGRIQLFRVHCLRLARLFLRGLRLAVQGNLSHPSFKAMLLGYRDYLFGRFGDCPGVVRHSTIPFSATEAPGKVEIGAQRGCPNAKVG